MMNSSIKLDLHLALSQVTFDVFSKIKAKISQTDGYMTQQTCVLVFSTDTEAHVHTRMHTHIYKHICTLYLYKAKNIFIFFCQTDKTETSP